MSSIIGIVLALFGGTEIVYAQEPEEPRVVLIEIETEVQRNERLVREAFPDAPIMVDIARCESEFRNVPSETGDHGVFQINQIHNERLAQLGLDRTKVEDNLKFARLLYEESGTQPWYMSKDTCWGK